MNLSQFDFPEVTPLIIQASWGEWYHPNIEQIVSILKHVKVLVLSLVLWLISLLKTL